MATMSVSTEQLLVVELSKLHPDYTVTLVRHPSRVYPYIGVTDGRWEVNIEIRLAEHYWTVKILDRLVVKAIENIEGEKRTSKKNSQVLTHKQILDKKSDKA